MSFITAALIVTGGTLLSSKIASNRQKDPKAAIGSGTAPSLASGEDLQFLPVEGSSIRDFGDFAVENPLEPESLDNQAEMIAYLQSQGISPEELGILGAASGGPIKMANGGGLGSILAGAKNIEELKALVEFMKNKPSINNEMLDLTSVPKPELPTDLALDIPDPSSLVTNMPVPDINLEQAPTGMIENAKIGLENLSMDNPALFNAGLGALTDILMAALVDMPEPKGMQVSTRTLPPAGNANRRRLQFDPIGMKNGGDPDKVLNRKMFTPMLSGGELDGPGGPKDDLIPIMASDGEFMLSKATVDLVGKGDHNKGIKTLEKLNNKGNRVYG